LVDSKCDDNEERNVNPTDTETCVDGDKDPAIRYYSPRAKTKSFAVVQHDGLDFKLDSIGNEKAIELVRIDSRQEIFVLGRGNRRKEQKHGQGGFDFNRGINVME